ncbi:DUF4160 domain-containing protein [Pseudomonas sp. GV071]|uniref:DUF4160 domain-containing protein n=1 Tax=Pseudomonas sp. GV071 TaxID=2135754 RepID=UPI000D3A1651|nr:DUF4160 domain-containing protein [Pseudomonas sp. GV071]
MLEQALELQRRLAEVDLMTRSTGAAGLFELLVLRLRHLAIRMEVDHHARAHVHIDYGRQRHAASFAVDTGERLVGRMPTKYDREIARWIEKNRDVLIQAWDAGKAGEDPHCLLALIEE